MCSENKGGNFDDGDQKTESYIYTHILSALKQIGKLTM